MYKRKKRTKKAKLIAQALVLLGMTFIVIISSFQLRVVREFFGQASGEEANLHIYTNNILGSYNRPWQNLAQGGEDANWRLTPLIPKVKALKPEYIRIDHLYDFYVQVDRQEGQLVFNFTKLDQIINDILSTGAKPYIALSYMPQSISNSDIIDTPQNYHDWQVVVQRTIEHVSGTRNINNVYYEVWNEPDLFGSWKYYGKKNYLTLYLYASKGASNARGVRSFKIGGPAITAFYKNWMEALVEYTTKNNLRLDFLSWHRYHFNIDQYKKDMIEARKILAKYPQLVNTELHITEWGADSDNNAIYDTRFSGAHTVAGAIEMVGVIDKAFSFEIQDGKDPENKEYWGRWGLFTNQEFGSKAKPRYYATWVKALAGKNTQDNNIEVVLANYDRQSKHSENVAITFEDIKAGNYTITKELTTGQHFTQTVATTSSKLQTHFFMPSNTVGYVTLSKN